MEENCYRDFAPLPHACAGFQELSHLVPRFVSHFVSKHLSHKVSHFVSVVFPTLSLTLACIRYCKAFRRRLFEVMFVTVGALSRLNSC